MIQLPYFDAILAACRHDETDVIRSFGDNVHWGYWDDPTAADGSVDDFVLASDAMTRKVCAAAGIRDGLTVLDAGCGFGGTVASINARFERMTLTGLNIDPRQIARARHNVAARPGNTIDFVVEDACQLPFADRSFDVVMAVECIFHFPSRLRFLREARRVLRPGGALMVSEFVAPARTFARLVLAGLPNLRTIQGFYGDDIPIPPSSYQVLARLARLGLPTVLDISRNVLPTFPVVLDLVDKFPIGERGQRSARFATELIARMSERGWMRYQVFTFRAPGAAPSNHRKDRP